MEYPTTYIAMPNLVEEGGNRVLRYARPDGSGRCYGAQRLLCGQGFRADIFNRPGFRCLAAGAPPTSRAGGHFREGFLLQKVEVWRTSEAAAGAAIPRARPAKPRLRSSTASVLWYHFQVAQKEGLAEGETHAEEFCGPRALARQRTSDCKGWSGGKLAIARHSNHNPSGTAAAAC